MGTVLRLRVTARWTANISLFSWNWDDHSFLFCFKHSFILEIRRQRLDL
jgi:hypothetical protein